MGAGDYETSLATPLTYTGAGIYGDGYQKDIEYEDVLKYLLIGNNTQGSDSSYLCDYNWLHRAGQTNILLVGGYWSYSGMAGVGCASSNNVASLSFRIASARLEFI
jgi:hypothetical protein